MFLLVMTPPFILWSETQQLVPDTSQTFSLLVAPIENESRTAAPSRKLDSVCLFMGTTGTVTRKHAMHFVDTQMSVCSDWRRRPQKSACASFVEVTATDMSCERSKWQQWEVAC